jgi:DinB family protein
MKTMKPVLHSLAYCLDFLREQVADIGEADMAAQPNGVQNHPAWVIGHLTLACQELGGVLGLSKWLPGNWAQRFGTGSVPVADASLYGTKDNALAMLSDAQSRVTHAVEELDHSRLDSPFPDESYRVVFPTIRHAITQVSSGTRRITLDKFQSGAGPWATRLYDDLLSDRGGTELALRPKNNRR